MKSSELRRWALDMYEYYSTKSDLLAMKAEVHRDRMLARADLEDAKAGRMPETAEVAEVVQVVPILGEIRLRGGKIVGVERPYSGEAEVADIHVAFEWRSDPTAEEEAGQICRIYIGTKQAGPVASWEAQDSQWRLAKSNGNFGKKYAFGGTWSSTKTETVPEIVAQIGAIMDKLERIKKAEAKLAAAEKRVMAAHTLERAAAYDRQAMNPSYAGQDSICCGKADTTRAFADKLYAEADLIEAKA